MMFSEPDCVVTSTIHYFHALKGPFVHCFQWHAPARPTEELQYTKLHDDVSRIQVAAHISGDVRSYCLYRYGEFFNV